eukprot:COSAG02_NODE_2111_length_9804_cov_5.586296_8_plen_63_part_00
MHRPWNFEVHDTARARERVYVSYIDACVGLPRRAAAGAAPIGVPGNDAKRDPGIVLVRLGAP